MLDVAIIGGSVAGLSAAMTLGRSLLKVACIDSGRPCNRYAPESHNTISFDGIKPHMILNVAKEKLREYKTVELCQDEVLEVAKFPEHFELITKNNLKFRSRKIIFASGINDQLEKLGIDNIYEYWGDSIIHCPFCHGYENADKRVGVCYQDANFLREMTKLIYNWNKNIVILTNGKSFEIQNLEELKKLKVEINSKKIVSVKGTDRKLEKVKFDDDTEIELGCMYLMPPYEVGCSNLLKGLDVELNEMNLIKVNAEHKTNIPGIFACGDSTTLMRSLNGAMSQGTNAGAFIAKEIATENWNIALKADL